MPEESKQVNSATITYYSLKKLVAFICSNVTHFIPLFKKTNKTQVLGVFCHLYISFCRLTTKLYLKE